MSKEEIGPIQIEMLVREALGSGKVNQWANLTSGVEGLAKAKKWVPKTYSIQNDAVALKLLRERRWDLLRQGLLMPTDNNFTFLGLTSRGDAYVASGEVPPHDPSGFLASIRARVPDLDAKTNLYLGEAVACFGSGNHIATAVMAGVAAENALVLLAEAMVDWLEGNESKNLKKELDGKRTASVLLREVRKKLDTRKRDLPSELQEHYEGHLTGFASTIRMHRNDAGHPSGKAFDAEDSLALLLLLRFQLGLIFDLRRWILAEAMS